MNALVGEDRTIVSPVSGTTRDAIDTEFTGPDGQVSLCSAISTFAHRVALQSVRINAPHFSDGKLMKKLLSKNHYKGRKKDIGTRLTTSQGSSYLITFLYADL